MDHAEVAVNGLGGVEEVGAGAGRVESAGDFETHVGGFAGAGDGDASGPFAGDAEQEIDGPEEGVVEAARDELKARRFGAEDAAGVVEPSVPPGRRFGQVDLQGHRRLHARGRMRTLASCLGRPRL